MAKKKYKEVTKEEILALRNNPFIADNRRACWSKESDKELSDLYNSGYGISAIAVLMSRTENSINLRIEELELKTPVNKRHVKTTDNEGNNEKASVCEDCLCSECKNHDRCEKRLATE